MRTLQILAGNDLERMRRACALGAATLQKGIELAKPGVTTGQLDRWLHEFILDHGAYPAPLNYPSRPTDPRQPKIDRGAFPRSICTSINDVVCHGVPSEKEVMKDGDIVNIDVTVLLDGFFGDTSATVAIGEVSAAAQALSAAAKTGMALGIEQVKAGAYVGDIGAAIQKYAEGLGYGVVREYCGHGIGRVFHADPQIVHVGKRGTGQRLMAGMCFTVEPMINQGKPGTRLDKDGWTVRTQDGKLSAQFEHTVLVTRDGVEVLTDPARIADHGYSIA